MANKSKKELADEAKKLETLKALADHRERMDTAEEKTPLTEELIKLSQTPPTPDKDQ